jgi:hypothetical protein
MKYACLIYGDENDPIGNPEQSTDGFRSMMAGYMAFNEAAGDKILAGEALEPTSTATTVQLVDGEIITTDGPFAETKEQLGGFYILECADLDEAIRYAAKIPHAAMGRVEVRPVPNFG